MTESLRLWFGVIFNQDFFLLTSDLTPGFWVLFCALFVVMAAILIYDSFVRDSRKSASMRAAIMERERGREQIANRIMRENPDVIAQVCGIVGESSIGLMPREKDSILLDWQTQVLFSTYVTKTPAKTIKTDCVGGWYHMVDENNEIIRD